MRRSLAVERRNLERQTLRLADPGAQGRIDHAGFPVRSVDPSAEVDFHRSREVSLVERLLLGVPGLYEAWPRLVDQAATRGERDESAQTS